ncbi:MAG: glycerophosphodiester phosphodiesterase family protein [Paracoccaceae bacterium]
MTRLSAEFLERPLAHRGLHDVTDGRPENSRSAILAAVEHGFGVEVDVQLSQDGAAMVFHDYVLERLTDEAGPVGIRTAESLRNISLTGSDEAIPDLPEILALVAGRTPLLIEIKDQDGEMGPDIGPLEIAVARAVEAYDGPLAIMSFNPFSIERMQALCPDVALGLVTSAYRSSDWPLSEQTCARLREIPDFDQLDVSFISHEADDLDRNRVAQLKQQGANILCWTVRSAEQEGRARNIADNITFEGYLPGLPS